VTLARRIHALERAVRASGLRERCSTCGFPDLSESRSVVVLNEGEPDLSNCPTCGRQVDREGRTVGSPSPDGRVMLLTIRLRPRPNARKPL
jgi:hypothetical protein